jgi:hypothetical protein
MKDRSYYIIFAVFKHKIIAPDGDLWLHLFDPITPAFMLEIGEGTKKTAVYIVGNMLEI